MTGVLFLNIALNCFPQVVSVEYQAKTDAEADAEANFDKSTWFMIGALGPMACIAGYAVGSLIAPELSPDYGIYAGYSLSPIDPNDAQFGGAVIGLAAGCLTSHLVMRFSPRHPSPERLLGKSPEYIQAYTDTYQSQMRSLQSRSAAGGLAFGTVAGCLILYGVSEN